MAEGKVHKHLKLVAMAFLKKHCVDIVSLETKFRNLRSISDACGLNMKRKEVRVIEVKATREDYLRDKKLLKLETSYFPHCHYFYIMCPTNVIDKTEVVDGIGLIYVDENDKMTIVKKPKKNKTLKTRFETTLKNSVRSITNDLVFKYHEIQNNLKTKYFE
jgi:hypothetical protein